MSMMQIKQIRFELELELGTGVSRTREQEFLLPELVTTISQVNDHVL